MEPACANACPTDSIQFGPLDELRERAAGRLAQMHAAGVADARLYGEDPGDGVGGDGAARLARRVPGDAVRVRRLGRVRGRCPGRPGFLRGKA
jgi:Fe-S-cluster-containing dehydrogenase component